MQQKWGVGMQTGELAPWQTSLAAQGKHGSLSLKFVMRENRDWNTAWSQKKKKKLYVYIKSWKIARKTMGSDIPLIFFFCALIITGCWSATCVHTLLFCCWCVYGFAWSYLTERIDLWLKTTVSRGLLWAGMKTFHTLVLMEKPWPSLCCWY